MTGAADRGGAVLTGPSPDRAVTPSGLAARLQRLGEPGRIVGRLAALTALSDWFPKLISFGTLMLVARHLGASSFAEFALALSWISYCWAAVDLGQAGYSVRALAGRTREEEARLGHEIFGLYLILAVVVSAALTVGVVVTGLAATPSGRLLLLMVPFLVSYGLFPDWWLRASSLLGALGAANTAAIAGFAAVVVLAPGADAGWYALAYALAPLAGAVVAWTTLARRRGIRFGVVLRWRAWRAHLRVSVLFAVAGAAGQLAAPLTLLGMAAAGDVAAAGAYAVGLRIAAAAAGALWLLIQNALPRVLGSRWQVGPLAAVASAVPALVALVVAAVLWRPVLAPLLGPSYADLGSFVMLGLLALAVWSAKFVVEMGLIAAYADSSRIIMNVAAPLVIGAALVTGFAGSQAAAAPIALLAGETAGVLIGLVLLHRARARTRRERAGVPARSTADVWSEGEVPAGLDR